IGFVALLLVTGRFHGLRALVGLAGSMLIIVEFVVPAILHGSSPLAVAIVGAFAVMLVMMPLSYGLGAKAIAAWLGTSGSPRVAAPVSTLLFAYAGASLPVLLIFSVGGTSFTDAVNGEAVADEIIAALVGSIGLIASMPITTALAALLAPRMSDRQLNAAHA